MTPFELHQQAMALAQTANTLRATGQEWTIAMQQALRLELRCIQSLPPDKDSEPTRQYICESGITLAGQLDDFETIRRICYLALGGEMPEKQRGFFLSCIRRADFSQQTKGFSELDCISLSLLGGMVGFGLADQSEVAKREQVVPAMLRTTDALLSRKPYEKSSQRGPKKSTDSRILRLADGSGSYRLSFALAAPLQGSTDIPEGYERRSVVDYLLELSQRLEDEDQELDSEVPEKYLAAFRDYFEQLRPDGNRVAKVELFGSDSAIRPVMLQRPKMRASSSNVGIPSSSRKTVVGVLVPPIKDKSITVKLDDSSTLVVFVERDSMREIVRGYYGDTVSVRVFWRANAWNLEAIDYAYESSDDLSNSTSQSDTFSIDSSESLFAEE